MIETVKHLTCDVFGTRRHVRRYRITIHEFDPHGNLFENDPIFVNEVDLGTRAFRRMMRFIQHGLRKPGKLPTAASQDAPST